MKGTVVVISPDEEINKFEYDYMPSLSMLQDWVGGYIELVPYFTQYEGRRCVAFCNEEGKLEGLPLNHVATDLWRQLITTPDVLVGTIIILYGDEAFMNAM